MNCPSIRVQFDIRTSQGYSFFAGSVSYITRISFYDMITPRGKNHSIHLPS
uniref:Uncharacterized protein n=1 Tax=Utricularia reniformis TaxID=192314 RepID=A0A1Y0B339_9LAMI|nr:hypothetical protein AEK19_MT1574 [Utricularia reniformis]ART31759.1 hypothetical protein AEK19_MT1574 [Utricularia reniformis]